MENRSCRKLRKIFEKFQLMDLIGFGTILGVRPVDDYEEYVDKIIENFQKKDAKAQKDLFKLAKDVSIQNIDDGVLNKKPFTRRGEGLSNFVKRKKLEVLPTEVNSDGN